MDGGGAFYSYNDDLMLKTDDSGSGQPTRIHIEGGIDATRIGIGMGTPQTELDVGGTIRQTASTNAVLVSNANGDIVSASNLADDYYVIDGQGGLQRYNVLNPGNWAGPPPNNLEEAIQRIAGHVAAAIGPIP